MQPLADKLRPKSLDDIVGQEHILGEGKILRRLIENKNVSSMILFGPPGTGKSSVASLLAKASGKKLFKLNGTTASVKDIQEIAKELNTLEGYNGVLVYFDEFHAFSRSRQSSILSYLETGEITLIASTTENPYHSIHPAILSRCMVFEFKPLSNEDIIKRLKVAIDKSNNSLRTITYDNESLSYIATISHGDLRKAISIIDLILKSYTTNNIHIDVKMVSQSTQTGIPMDKSAYYDCVSMLQKAIRASNPDASLIALGLIINNLSNSDENNNSFSSNNHLIDSLLRRILTIYSEEIGLSGGNMYSTIFNLCSAAKMVGWPENRIILSHIIIQMALIKKSPSCYFAIDKALEDVKTITVQDIQPYLKDAHYSGAEKLGRTGYKYPYDYPNYYVEQEYMPEKLIGKVYYIPGDNKFENAAKEYWDSVKNNLNKTKE